MKKKWLNILWRVRKDEEELGMNGSEREDGTHFLWNWTEEKRAEKEVFPSDLTFHKVVEGKRNNGLMRRKERLFVMFLCYFEAESQKEEGAIEKSVTRWLNIFAQSGEVTRGRMTGGWGVEGKYKVVRGKEERRGMTGASALQTDGREHVRRLKWCSTAE